MDHGTIGDDDASFPVEHRQLRYFSGSTTLMPLFFRLNAVNAAVFPVKRRQWRYYSG